MLKANAETIAELDGWKRYAEEQLLLRFKLASRHPDVQTSNPGDLGHSEFRRAYRLQLDSDAGQESESPSPEPVEATVAVEHGSHAG